jgi:hypothetical protein
MKTILSRWLRIFTLLCAVLGLRTDAAEDSAPLGRETVVGTLKKGIAALNERYWSPTLCIWFDRPGDDLRAYYERRLNPPWWCSANGVEMLLDAAAVTGDASLEARAAALYELHKDNTSKRAPLFAELRRRGILHGVSQRIPRRLRVVGAGVVENGRPHACGKVSLHRESDPRAP